MVTRNERARDPFLKCEGRICEEEGLAWCYCRFRLGGDGPVQWRSVALLERAGRRKWGGEPMFQERILDDVETYP